MMMTQTFNRRHSPNRRKTRVPARLQTDDRVLSVVILDISYEGMKLATPERIEPGMPVTIEALDARVPAIVHWSSNRRAGVHLLDRLDRETLIALETAEDELAEFR